MSTKVIRRLINVWPPSVFSGIRVSRITPDWRHIEVVLRLRWWNRNAVGTMFGGSLFAMIDPSNPLMLISPSSKGCGDPTLLLVTGTQAARCERLLRRSEIMELSHKGISADARLNNQILARH